MRLEVVEEAGSTSSVLKERAEAGLEEQALMARRQSAGRGQSGRVWQSTRGNLHLSVLLRPGALRRPGHWSILAGVVAWEAVASCLRDGRAGGLRLKWPNDLMLEGGKVAGVLAEAGLGARPWIVLGFGVNVVAAPEGAGQAVAWLEDGTAPGVDAEALGGTMLQRLAAWRAVYAEQGFGPVAAAWGRAGPHVGEAVRTSRVAGVFEGLTEEGAMRLRVDGQERVVWSGGGG